MSEYRSTFHAHAVLALQPDRGRTTSDFGGNYDPLVAYACKTKRVFAATPVHEQRTYLLVPSLHCRAFVLKLPQVHSLTGTIHVGLDRSYPLAGFLFVTNADICRHNSNEAVQQTWQQISASKVIVTPLRKGAALLHATMSGCVQNSCLSSAGFAGNNRLTACGHLRDAFKCLKTLLV